jgi:D-aspartate ligase
VTTLLRSPPDRARVEPVTTAGAVVIGSDYRGLAVVRSLGRRGIPVWVLRNGDDTLATHSRYAKRSLILEGESDEQQVAFLMGLGLRYSLDGWTLFPTSNMTAAMVARHRDRLAEKFTLTTPSWEKLCVAYDKRLTYSLAADLGVAHPCTWTARDAIEAAALPVAFPVIVKPAVSQLVAAKAWRADNCDELAARFREAAARIDPSLLLIQELIPGGGEAQFSFAALCDNGTPIASVVARRVRQYPADFGRASTFVETTNEPRIEAAGRRVVAAMQFSGLVEVEFKHDARDDTDKLLDINPRVWGWHSLCGRAGVDFPYLALRLARSQPVERTTAVNGVRWLRLSTDLPMSLSEILRGKLSAHEYLSSFRGPRESAIFARDDPWPGICELPMLIGIVIRRLAHRRDI